MGLKYSSAIFCYCIFFCWCKGFDIFSDIVAHSIITKGKQIFIHLFSQPKKYVEILQMFGKIEYKINNIKVHKKICALFLRIFLKRKYLFCIDNFEITQFIFLCSFVSAINNKTAKPVWPTKSLTAQDLNSISKRLVVKIKNVASKNEI